MKRVLVVHAGNIAGGVEQAIASMLRITKLHGDIEMHVALVFDGPVADLLRGTGADVEIIGPARTSRPLSLWQSRRRLSAVMMADRPVAVLTQSAWTLGLYGGVVRRKGLPLVHFVHDTLVGRHWTERLAGRQRPDLLVCNSHYSATCAGRVFPGTPHVVMYPPVAASTTAASRVAIRKGLGASPETLVITQVGRADPLKGHRVLLEALERLSDDPRWVCWQVGAPQRPAERSYWAVVMADVRNRGLGDRVRFLGPRTDVGDVLGASDVYCQPNVGPEAFGLTLVEAMAASLPVVTSALGAAPEVLDGTGNVPVAPADPTAVAAALRALLHDPALRRRLGCTGAQRAREIAAPERAYRVLVDAVDRVSPGRHS